MAAIQWKSSLELVTQAGPRIRASAHVLLVLLLAYSLAQLTWRVLPAPEVSNLLPLSVTAEAVSSDASGQNQISQWHLFGTVSSQTVAAKPMNLPETTLKLILRGLIASPDPKEARAIIANPAGKEDFYKIGDKLPGNAELKEIHADRVVIRRGARYETLKLPKKSLGMKMSDSLSPVLSHSSRQNNSYTLSQYRNALLNNPQQVADLIHIAPANKAGKFVGYRLQPGRDARMLSRYGLLPGDIVTSVNGVVLDNPTKGLGLLKQLATAGSLDIEIDRNGARQRFALPID